MAFDRNNTDLLRFSVIGSVDDGKSTLIGRLLYDTKSIMEDQQAEIEASSKRRGEDYVNLALLTDGLKAEREQGITIDVAYRYFTTEIRKFIIADCPGHIQYTRNMVTGTSSAQAAVILIDARHGVVEQTRRHAYITDLMGVKHLVVCINKMDLVDFDEKRFQQIQDDLNEFLKNLNTPAVHYIPISALNGDNVVDESEKMPWYTGKCLLKTLEMLEIEADTNEEFSRFPVQRVIRPMSDEFHDYRGYAGRVQSGRFNVGDRVVALPSGVESTISRIHLMDEEFKTVVSPTSVTMCLSDDIDISRGDMIVKKDEHIPERKELELLICWLNEKPFQMSDKLLIKHTTNLVKSQVKSVDYKLDIQSFEKRTDDSSIKMNDIVKISVKTNKPIFADTYAENQKNGFVILINQQTNNTVAAGMVL